MSKTTGNKINPNIGNSASKNLNIAIINFDSVFPSPDMESSSSAKAFFQALKYLQINFQIYFSKTITKSLSDRSFYCNVGVFRFYSFFAAFLLMISLGLQALFSVDHQNLDQCREDRIEVES